MMMAIYSLSHFLDPEQGSLRVELEGNLLPGRATVGVPVQLSYLLDLPHQLANNLFTYKH